MEDIALIFPPQWSAFQPPLSLPALSAWLRRSGLSASVFDANVAFYEWLFSDECKQLLSEEIDRGTHTASERESFESLLQALPDFRQSLADIKSAKLAGIDDGRFLLSHQQAVRSLETWLSFVSHISQDFHVTPYGFHLKGRAYDEASLNQAVIDAPPLLRAFVRNFVRRHIADRDFASVGLSCIGQEQLYFTLLFCAAIKEVTNVPIMVGGTIFTRIYERGKLPLDWLERYFAVVVKNEGERPCERMLLNLRSGLPLTEDVPGIVFKRDEALASSPSPPALVPSEMPTPDFDGMPLASYLSPALTLPILSARGCYWGKCEFCHHGMVYGSKYAAYDVSQLLGSIRELADRYNVRHFSFNDEALPPKIAREIGRSFPSNAETGWNFTALYKFEKFYLAEDFVNLRRIGMRCLYVGMESASERVLSLMKKPNQRAVVTRNLRDAKEAGLWTHCFLFFGFPGETEEDAQETYDYVFSNQEIIGSVGCGTFAFEHNAPMFSHPAEFGVTLSNDSAADLSVYYSYVVGGGLGQDEATDWAKKFNNDLYDIPKYIGVAWIPREHLLLMLSIMPPERLVEVASRYRVGAKISDDIEISQVFSPVTPKSSEGGLIVINRLTSRVLRLRNHAASLFNRLYDERSSLGDIKARYPKMHAALISQGSTAE